MTADLNDARCEAPAAGYPGFRAVYTGGWMTKRLVEIDDAVLEEARRALGTVTIKDTVNTALDGAAKAARRRAVTIEGLLSVGELLEDLGDPEIMARAWE